MIQEKQLWPRTYNFNSFISKTLWNIFEDLFDQMQFYGCLSIKWVILLVLTLSQLLL